MDLPATYLMIGSDGAVYGPADVAGLQAWAREGRVTLETWLKEQGTGRQFRAAELPALSASWPAPVFGMPALTPPHPAVPSPTVGAGLCGNCRRAVAPGVRFCPYCGFGGGSGQAERPPPRLLTGAGLGDYVLGLLPALLVLISPAALALAASGPAALSGPLFWLAAGIILGVLVWRLTAPYPVVKRGLGTALLLALLALPILGVVGVVAAVTSALSTPFKPCNF